MEGLALYTSTYSVLESINRVTELLKNKGYHIFGEVDHQNNAHKYGETLRPTKLVIFGNPQIGTCLMVDQQSIAIDLPSKILAWEDETGKTYLAHNKMAWLAERHQLSIASTKTLSTLEEVLKSVCLKAAQKE